MSQAIEAVVVELGVVSEDWVAGAVVVEDFGAVPADLVDDPPSVSASTTATATTALGAA